MKKILIFFLLSLVFTSCYNRERIVDKTKLLGMDYRLFQGTPVWDLAKAVEDEDIQKITYLVQQEQLPIDFQEERFGKTLLLIAVTREQYKSVKVLLELGADPNKKDTNNGTSPIIEASGRIGLSSDDPKVLKLLLQYGGDPNDEEVGERGKGNWLRRTPLAEASRYSLEKVKLLVEAGADVNHENEYSRGPIRDAIISNKMDIVLYLLENGAMFDRPIFNNEGNPRYICDVLITCLYPLDSQEYKDKMKVLSFLKQRGVDCRETPIPDYVLKKIKERYPDNWEEYIKKY
jgi:ankyrin repeat protein